MRRRTNLFYNNTVDSNFLTFSNFTEHLTGVFLATNYKMFPSRFLCINIPWLEIESHESRSYKQIFIEDYLVAYYENKLAVLRDKIIYELNVDVADIKQPDDLISYLGYLIDTIKRFDEDMKTASGKDLESSIVFQSTITEQDFNGTFTDIICTIDSGIGFNTKYNINDSGLAEDSVSISKVTNNNFVEYLYGWSNKHLDDSGIDYTGPDMYRNVKPKFDNDEGNDVKYRIQPKHSIETVVSSTNLSEAEESMSFNVIVPLYSITNMDFVTNTTYLDELSDINTSVVDMDSHADNVPYGIWFANETITLKRDTGSNYAPSWSLLIGTQFKPFPTTKKLEQDFTKTNLIKGDYIQIDDTVSRMAGFATYAQIMSKQADLYNILEHDMEEKCKKIIAEIENQKTTIEDIYKKLVETTDFEELRKLYEKLKELLESDEDDSIAVNLQHKWTIE